MKRTLLIAASLVALLFLSGCRQDVSSGPAVNGGEAIQNASEKIANKVDESKNAIQQNMQALLGAEIGKITDQIKGVEANVQAKVTGVENKVDKIETHIDTKITGVENKVDKLETHINAQTDIDNKLIATLQNQIEINTKLNAQIEVVNKMNAELQAQLQAQVKANAELTAKVDAVAGIGNHIQELTNRMEAQAGRDVTQIQFNTNMLDALRSANWVAVGISLIICLTVILVGWRLMHNNNNTIATAVRSMQPPTAMGSKDLPKW